MGRHLTIKDRVILQYQIEKYTNVTVLSLSEDLKVNPSTILHDSHKSPFALHRITIPSFDQIGKRFAYRDRTDMVLQLHLRFTGNRIVRFKSLVLDLFNDIFLDS